LRILDSDHCVALLRGTLDLRDRVPATEELAITAISVGELAHGAAKSHRAAENLARVDVLLAATNILPFDERSARRFGILKAELERAGTRLADLDLQIASIALQAGAPLVTHNRQHFERIPGLGLEDWLET
jgi:tRNA(fMet)-specific endonuclease VapC